MHDGKCHQGSIRDLGYMRGGITMKLTRTLTELLSGMFMHVAEASASSTSCILWNEPKCPEELLK